MEIIVDKEFRSLIPPLRDEELRDLETAIITDGCRDALVVWQGILLDGHNRLEICQKNKLKFKTVSIELPDRIDARLWIGKNQLARRNLTDFSRAELVLKLKPEIAAKAKENQGMRTDLNFGQKSDGSKDTKHQLASLAGVSHDTIAKVETVLEYADEKTKSALRSGKEKTSINKVYKKIKEKKRQR